MRGALGLMTGYMPADDAVGLLSRSTPGAVEQAITLAIGALYEKCRGDGISGRR